MSTNDHNGATEQYMRLKQHLDQSFPTGRFVAVELGKVIADAESHRQVVAKLRSQGKSPNGILIVQAGIEYPKSAVIFLVS
jgi:hypothetical protein